MTDPQSHLALDIGTMVQEYRLTKVLGMGGFGIVYVAENIYLDEIVAIKEFLPVGLATRIDKVNIAPLSVDQEEVYDWALKNFLKEARILWELSHPEPHPSIVRVIRFHEENGTAYMVMDFEDGQSLSSVLKQVGRIPEVDLRALLEPLLDGLERVHAASIWHRDIKPDNILVRSGGSPVLIDFGAAHWDSADNDQSLMAVYSLAYAAPEQVFPLGNQGPWTDIYSLGATLYQATTGAVPTCASERFSKAVCASALELGSGEYSPSLLRAIDAALALAPEDRPQSIREWRHQIQWSEPSGQGASDKTLLMPTLRAPPDPVLSSQDKLASDASTSRQSAEAVTARAKDTHPQHVTTAKKRKAGVIALLLGCAAIVVGGGLLWWAQQSRWLLGGDEQSNALAGKDRTAEVGVATDVTASTENGVLTEDRATLLAGVSETLTAFECAHLKPMLDDELRLRISGFVRSSSDLKQLGTALGASEKISEIDYDVSVMDWPYCEVAALLADHQAPNIAPDAGVMIIMNKPGHTYKEGELMMVTAISSRLHDGYLYIDYIDSAGDVVHMFPTQSNPVNQVSAGQRVVVGAERLSGDSQHPVYQVFPPHGQNMIIAFLSPEPLFSRVRKEIEPASEYFESLRESLSRNSSLGEPVTMLSNYHFIYTHE